MLRQARDPWAGRADWGTGVDPAMGAGPCPVGPRYIMDTRSVLLSRGDADGDRCRPFSAVEQVVVVQGKKFMTIRIRGEWN